MNYQEIDLSAIQEVKVNSISLSFEKLVNSNDKGRRFETLRLTSSSGSQIELKNAVDNSQCLDNPRVFLIYSDLVKDNVIIFGGKIVYWISVVSFRTYKSWELDRTYQDVEYWNSEIISVKFGLLVVDEAGFFLINDQLDLVWYRGKYYNEQLKLYDEETVKITSDDAHPEFYSLKEGKAI